MQARQSLKNCVRRRGLALWNRDVKLRCRIVSFLKEVNKLNGAFLGAQNVPLLR